MKFQGEQDAIQDPVRRPCCHQSPAVLPRVLHHTGSRVLSVMHFSLYSTCWVHAGTIDRDPKHCQLLQAHWNSYRGRPFGSSLDLMRKGLTDKMKRSSKFTFSRYVQCCPALMTSAAASKSLQHSATKFLICVVSIHFNF